MFCDICHEREATIHMTHIVGDAVSPTHFCSQCYEASKPAEARGLTAALDAGCRYCGGEPYTGSGHSPDGLSSISNLSFMCKPCAEEYFGFLRLKMPGFGSDTLTTEQAAKLAKYDRAAIFTEAEEHMKKWVAERDSH
jgi:protein-arginine kinase activator protein McsA